MAIVVALNNKNQSCKGLAELLKYVSKENKTNLESGQKLVSGINCSPDAAYNEFIKSEGYEVSWADNRKYICYTTPTDTERGFDTDYRANGTIGTENRQTANSKSGRDDEEIKLTFRTGWESSRRNLRENRKRLEENLHQDFSDNDGSDHFNNINYGNFKRLLILVKSFQRLGKRRGIDEDDTPAVAMMTGLTASTVTILIEVLKNMSNDELSEMFAEEKTEKINEDTETEFGEIKM